MQSQLCRVQSGTMVLEPTCNRTGYGGVSAGAVSLRAGRKIVNYWPHTGNVHKFVRVSMGPTMFAVSPRAAA